MFETMQHLNMNAEILELFVIILIVEILILNAISQTSKSFSMSHNWWVIIISLIDLHNVMWFVQEGQNQVLQQWDVYREKIKKQKK